MKIKLSKGAFMPERAHDNDAGLDLKAPHDALIPAGHSVIIDTGVHVELPKNTVGMIKSRSGLLTRHNIVTEGTIDEGYRGSIAVKLLNHSKVTDYRVHKGDKIAQLVVLPCLFPSLELVDDLTETDRGDNGFGSTGR